MRFESRHQAGQRRLARAGRAEHISHLSRPELERCAVDRGDRAEAFHQSFQDDADHDVERDLSAARLDRPEPSRPASRLAGNAGGPTRSIRPGATTRNLGS